jgi:hypothetical protein
MLWVNFPRHKKEIVISSLLGILDAKYPDWENNKMVALYQKQNSLFGLDMRRLDSFASQSLRNVDVSTAKNNIRKVLKKQ